MRLFFWNFWFVLIITIPIFCVVCSAETGAGEETLLVYAKAKLLYDKGDFAGTVKLLESGSGTGRFPPALALRGKAAYFSDDLNEAERLFRRTLDFSPSNAEAGLYLARTLRETGRADEARAVVESLLADDPSDLRVLRLAAAIALDKGAAGESEAASFLDRAAEASSEAALVFLERARIKWIAGDGGAAREDLERASAFSGSTSPLGRAIRHLEHAIYAENTSRHGQL
jgi:uncharacterized protein HemY